MADRYQEARDRITGDSWLDDLARMSLSAAEAKFGPKPEHEVYVTPESFRVTIIPAKCLRGTDLRHWSVAVEPVAAHFAVFYDGELDDGWIVTDGGRVLGKDGAAWSYGRGSDAAVPAWIAAHVHARLADALDAARDFAPKVTINGLTAAEVLARHRERNLGCCNG